MNSHYERYGVALIFGLCLGMVGCTTVVTSPSAPSGRALDEIAATLPSGGLIRDGILALYDGDGDTAAKAFSLALREDPENQNLHFLNGLAYHIGFVQGQRSNLELAETGYLVALRLDPTHGPATAMLGQLYLDSGRNDLAQNTLMRSYGLDHDNLITLQGLAVASYYTHDIPTAVWAIEKVENGEPAWTVNTARNAAMIHAAAGDFTTADNRLAIYASLENDPFRTRAAKNRVLQWQRTHTELRLAQATTSQMDDASAQESSTTQADADPAEANADSTVNDNAMISPNWRACDQAALDAETAAAANAATAAASGTPALTADEASALPALPSPCKNSDLPRMAVIDAVIIRSQDLSTTSKGVNLLNGLQITLGGNLIDYSRVHTQDTAQFSQNNRSFTVGFPTASAAITYNLNIANATDTRNEVIARPSIVALDRQASTFFSGTNLTTVSSGQYGGNSVDHQAGVSLSVTPTFINDDNMLLAIKASRSFFDGTALTLSGTVPSSRSVVQANVRIRYGQTLVLSGLNERESQGGENGVPILMDVPLLQYFFSNKTTREFNKTVLILMTPRRADPMTIPLANATQDDVSPELADVRVSASALLATGGNLALIQANLQNSTFYRQFQSGDLKAEVWNRPSDIRTILDDFIGLLMF